MCTSVFNYFMHRYQFDGRRKSNPLKRVLASSKREVLFEPPKKKRPLLDSSLVSILTSRPNSADLEKGSRKGSPRVEDVKREITAKASQSSRKPPNSLVSASQFYETKSALERQYERRLQKFLPTADGSDFLVLLEGMLDLPVPLIDVVEPGEPIKPEEELEVIELEEPEEPVVIDSEYLESLLSGSKGPDFHIAWLVHNADDFIQRAHKSVLDANDIQGTKSYYKLVKLAVKSLQMVVRKYTASLNPELELVVYYKLAQLYYSETENLHTADHYINKAISLATRHNLVKIRVTSEFLCSRILEASNPNLLSSYLVEKHATYSSRGLHNIADLFALARVNNLLVTDTSTGLTALHSIGLRKGVHPMLRTLCLLYQANLHLHRGVPDEGHHCIMETSTLLADAPPQLLAMCHLLQFAYYIQVDNIEQGKACLQVLSDFVSLQRKNHWGGWREDGSFEIHVPILKEETIPFRVLWLNSDEFVIVFYFLSGVLFLSEGNNYKRTNKVFSTCLDIIELQLKELTKVRVSSRNFPISQLTGKIVRLNFLRYSVHFYRVWLSFMQNDFKGIVFLQSFIKDFNEDNFTKEELCYYKLLIPRILYLTATYFQAHGDWRAAKYYFARVRHMSSSSQSTSGPEISLLQKGLGIGCESSLAKDTYSELHLYSTLHLLLLTEYEMRMVSQIDSDESRTKTARCRTYLGMLYADLTHALEKDGTNFSGSNALFRLSFKSVVCVYFNKGLKENQNTSHVPEITKLLETVSGASFAVLLAKYVLFRLSVSLDQSKKYLEECMKMVENDENVLGIFVLLEISGREQDPAQADLLHLKILGLRDKLSSKFIA